MNLNDCMDELRTIIVDNKTIIIIAFCRKNSLKNS